MTAIWSYRQRAFVIAAESGIVEFIAPEGYAVGILAGDGIEYILHIGVETVFLEGCGFIPLDRRRTAGEKRRQADRI